MISIGDSLQFDLSFRDGSRVIEGLSAG
jgi:hypothetical protein